jgi:hypothetical protein
MKNYLNYNLAEKFSDFLEVKELEFETDNYLFVDIGNNIKYSADLEAIVKLKIPFEQSYTFEDVIDFFIETFNVHIEVNYNNHWIQAHDYQYFYDLTVKKINNSNEELMTKAFDTKHQAIEYGINSVIDYLKENKMSKLTFNEISKNNIEISFNKIGLGSLILLENGYFNWFPTNFNGSCIDKWVLIQIVEKLNELNRDYENQLNENFKNQLNEKV